MIAIAPGKSVNTIHSMANITLDIEHLQLPKKPSSVELNDKGELVFDISGKQDYKASVMQLFNTGVKFVKFEYNKENIEE